MNCHKRAFARRDGGAVRTLWWNHRLGFALGFRAAPSVHLLVHRLKNVGADHSMKVGFHVVEDEIYVFVILRLQHILQSDYVLVWVWRCDGLQVHDSPCQIVMRAMGHWECQPSVWVVQHLQKGLKEDVLLVACNATEDVKHITKHVGHKRRRPQPIG